MNKLISLGVAGLLLVVYKILEYFHLQNLRPTFCKFKKM